MKTPAFSGLNSSSKISMHFYGYRSSRLLLLRYFRRVALLSHGRGGLESDLSKCRKNTETLICPLRAPRIWVLSEHLLYPQNIVHSYSCVTTRVTMRECYHALFHSNTSRFAYYQNARYYQISYIYPQRAWKTTRLSGHCTIFLYYFAFL